MLVFVAMPIKYGLGDGQLVSIVGAIHGALFLVFLMVSLQVGIEERWKVNTTIKVLVASVIPFGTFYIDKKILKPIFLSL